MSCQSDQAEAATHPGTDTSQRMSHWPLLTATVRSAEDELW